MPTTGNPYQGRAFWLDPNRSSLRATNAENDPYKRSMLTRISSHATAAWVGDWFPQPQNEVTRITTDAQNKNAVPTIVVYAIPVRDLGSYSGGGLSSAAAYRTWTDQVAAGIGARRAVVVVEPDALPQADGLDATKRAERFSLIRYAVDKFAALPNCWTYVDCGNSTWRSVTDMVNAINQCSPANLRGFALNTSNFNRTPEEIAYGNSIANQLGGNKSFIVDTSRNGLGKKTTGTLDERIINPEGRALGERPIAPGPDPRVDALLWTKIVGESDGNRAGAPPAGTFYPSYAIGLAERAQWDTAPTFQNSTGTAARATTASLQPGPTRPTTGRQEAASLATTTLVAQGSARPAVPEVTSPRPTFQPRLRLSETGVVVTGQPQPTPAPLTANLARTALTTPTRTVHPGIRVSQVASATTSLRLEVSGTTTGPGAGGGVGAVVVARASPASLAASAALVAATTTRARRAPAALLGLRARGITQASTTGGPDTWSLWTGAAEVPLAALGWWFNQVLYPLAGITAGADPTTAVAASAPTVSVADDGLTALNATVSATKTLVLSTVAITVEREDGARYDSTFGFYATGALTAAVLGPGSPLTLSGARYLGQGRYRALVTYTLSDAFGALEHQASATTVFDVVYAFDRPLFRTLHRNAEASLRANGRPGAAVLVPGALAFVGREANAVLNASGVAAFPLPGGGGTTSPTPPPRPSSQPRLRLRSDGIVVAVTP